MNTDNQSNQQNGQQAGDRPAQEAESGQARRQTEDGVWETIGSAMRRGAEAANKVVEEAVPKIKSAATHAAYWTAYGISFAAAFQWHLAKNLAPEPLKAGHRDGVKAGRDAADKWVERMRQHKEKAASAAPDQTGPSSGAAQPGAV